MAGISSPLNRFRRHNNNNNQTLHERWGDASISAPTNGSWNQFHRSRRSSSQDPDHRPLIPSHSSRQSPSTMGPLNPRRLSLRLKPRGADDTNTNNNHLQVPSPRPTGQLETRPEFIYKQVRQPDYPTIVAETATTNHQLSLGRSHPSPRFQYLSVGAGDRTSTASSGQFSPYYSHGDFYDEDEYEDEEQGGYGHRESREKRGSFRLSISGSDKRRSRTVRSLTTVMVPNADEMYG